MREWWVGERKDNRDRKFGGLEVPSLLALLVQKYKYCGGLEVLTLLALLVQKYKYSRSWRSSAVVSAELAGRMRGELVVGVREVREAGVTGAGALGLVLLMTLPRLIREWC